MELKIFEATLLSVLMTTNVDFRKSTNK